MDLLCCKSKKKTDTRKRHIVPPTERYIQFLNSVIEEKSFDVTKTVDYGYFGGSVIVKHDETGAELKVRIVKEEYIGDKECEWDTFNHRNLLPLFKLEYLKSSGSYLFYSGAEESTLEEKITDKYFRKDAQSLWKLLYWLEGIADAVQYLHSNGYGHLNLQAKSMIITKDDVVKISEFHYLSMINRRTEKFGFPQALRSPEAFLDYGGEWPVKPGPFDSWSLGILIIELFTGFHLSKKFTKKVTTWTKQAYPVIFDVLKKYKFNRLVSKAFPKAYGTVDLKIIRYLTAYTLTFDPSNRPSAKQLHNLFIMLNIQKSFFSKIKMEFKKDKIWEKKIEWKKFQKHFLKLSVKDNLELLREEDASNSDVQAASCHDIRSDTTGENDSVAEDLRKKTDEKIESSEKKVDRLIIDNTKHKSKKENKVLLKTEDTIKMAYTAFTFHDPSAFETSVFDLKSASSELSGVQSGKVTASNSEMGHLQKNIEISKMSIGDASPEQGLEELQGNMHNRNKLIRDTPPEREMEQFQPNIQSSILNINDTSPESNIILDELKEYKKETGAKSEVYSGKKSSDENEKEVKTGKNYFSIGKQMMQNIIKWSFGDYEVGSSSNYMNRLSKRLTK